MDFDDLPLKKSEILTDLEKEGLSEMSAHELEDRIERLRAEITRAEVALQSRGSSRDAAEAFFK